MATRHPLAHLLNVRCGGVFLLLLLLPFSSVSFAANLSGQVINISEDNRILLQTPSGQRHWIELSGIRPAPFSGRKSAFVKRQLQTLIAGRFVSVEPAARLPSGVILGRVLHGGDDIGLRLIRSGLALAADTGSSIGSDLQRAYRQAEAQARRHKMGYWQITR